MELSNFLLVRSREATLFHNNLHNPDSSFKSGKDNNRKLTEKLYAEAHGQLMENMPRLRKVMVSYDSSKNLPVAFATNAMYLMARHNAVCKYTFNQILIPIIK